MSERKQESKRVVDSHVSSFKEFFLNEFDNIKFIQEKFLYSMGPTPPTKTSTHTTKKSTHTTKKTTHTTRKSTHTTNIFFSPYLSAGNNI